MASAAATDDRRASRTGPAACIVAGYVHCGWSSSLAATVSPVNGSRPAPDRKVAASDPVVDGILGNTEVAGDFTGCLIVGRGLNVIRSAYPG